LDPGERNRFYNLLSEIGEQVIVILSTHIVEDVKELCSQMAIIDKGRVLYAGSPDDALKAVDGKIWKRQVAKQDVPTFSDSHPVISTRMVAGRPLVHVYQEQGPGPDFEPVHPDLEDVFFTYIKGFRTHPAQTGQNA
ncbi:MAG: ABC transporter ATP-binding protein, partial [Bacteroidia bacterium]|nr:ABC transporter ATP-binding protein [Bacteroidia bacterium]